MNTQLEFRSLIPITPRPTPLVRAFALVTRMQGAFTECALSLSVLSGWIREQLGLEKAWSTAARAVDDTLEPALVELETALPELKAALRNDPPAQRRAILTAIAHVIAAAKETHTRTEALSKEIDPHA